MDSRRKLNIEIKFVVSDNAIIMSKHIVSKKNEKVIVFNSVFIISVYLPFHLQEYH